MRLVANIALVMSLAAGCTLVSRNDSPLSPTRTQSICFGTSDFRLPSTDAPLSIPAGTDAEVGGAIALPRELPQYTTRVSAGVAETSIGRGRPAYVLQFHSTSDEFPLGTLIYADRGVCELTPHAPDQTRVVNGHDVYVWTSFLKVDSGVHGVVVLNGLYVDITLAWPTHSAPPAQTRIEYLLDWVRRMAG